MANSRLLFMLLAATAAVAACAPGEVREGELDEHLCSIESLGDDFQELIRGEFTPRDLANLADDSGERAEAYRAAGMKDGKFVYFKSVLPKPPFDPPLNIVCQTIEFESGDSARAWVAGLEADESLLESSAFGWVPDARIVSEVATEQPDRTLARAFRVGATGADGTTNVFIRSGSEGRFVRTVAAGVVNGSGRELEQVVRDIWARETSPE